MARDTQLESLLARLLAGPQLLGADSGSIVACKRSIELQAVDLPFSTIEAASDADIVEHILGSAAVVVVSYTLPMAVARALLDRSHPLLFVLTGPAPTSSTARELMQRGSPVVATLGPHGAIRRTALGHGLASYHSPRLFLRQPGERTGPDDCVGVQIAPTPMWLPELLHHPEFADQPAVCWVEAENLDARWRELRDRPSSTIVVPLGATEPFDVRPRDPAIDVACLAHDCELATGPVAPSPMVTHALLRMLSKPKASESDQASDAWNQVCRVFPSLSKNPEMTEPAVDLRSFDPLSAYIAQLSFARSQRRNKSRAFLRTAAGRC